MRGCPCIFHRRRNSLPTSLFRIGANKEGVLVGAIHRTPFARSRVLLFHIKEPPPKERRVFQPLLRPPPQALTFDPSHGRVWSDGALRRRLRRVRLRRLALVVVVVVVAVLGGEGIEGAEAVEAGQVPARGVPFPARVSQRQRVHIEVLSLRVAAEADPLEHLHHPQRNPKRLDVSFSFVWEKKESFLSPRSIPWNFLLLGLVGFVLRGRADFLGKKLE